MPRYDSASICPRQVVPCSGPQPGHHLNIRTSQLGDFLVAGPFVSAGSTRTVPVFALQREQPEHMSPIGFTPLQNSQPIKPSHVHDPNITFVQPGTPSFFTSSIQ